MRITGLLNKEYAGLVDLYRRRLYAKPELSLQGKETASSMVMELAAAGFEVITGVAGVLRSGPGKAILVRTDMEALPIAEKTNVPYASSEYPKDEEGSPVPIMHASSHDMHMTIWTGVVRIISQPKLPSTHSLFFIPDT